MSGASPRGSSSPLDVWAIAVARERRHIHLVRTDSRRENGSRTDSRREPPESGRPVGVRDVATDPDAMARILAFALAGTAALAALALALPDSVTTRDLGTAVPVAALAAALVVVAVAAFVAGSGLPRLWFVQGALGGAITLVGVAVHLGDASPTF